MHHYTQYTEKPAYKIPQGSESKSQKFYKLQLLREVFRLETSFVEGVIPELKLNGLGL